MKKPNSTTKYLFTDVDGCLSLGRGCQFELDGIRQLREAVKLNNIELFLISGRSQPYLEAVAQLLGNTNPLICENGACVYSQSKDEYIYTTGREKFNETRQHILDSYGDSVKFEPGKEFSLSFRVGEEWKMANIDDEYKHILENSHLPSGLTVTHSGSAIDIVPAGVNKGVALRWIANQYDLELEKAFGFGDSQNDMEFLNLVGYSGAPSNATEAINQLVNYVSPEKEVYGLLDFVQHLSQREKN